MNEQIKHLRFLMDAGFAKSSWKKWQQALFDEARKYDHQLFTGQGIENLCDTLEYLGGKLKGDVQIRRPDWDFFVRYDRSPSIQLGDGCYITFRHITADYFNN